MSKYQFKLPDIGEGIVEGTIGEWHVKVGDEIQKDGDLVQIENDKSVEELPSPVAGKVTKILVSEGQTAEVGDSLIELEVAAGQGNVADEPVSEPKQQSKAPTTTETTSESSIYQFKLPDIGEGIAEGTVGEWHVKVGDEIQKDGDLVQIENDKSVEELPSPVAGKITKIVVAEGESAEVGDPLVELEVAAGQGNVSATVATPTVDKTQTSTPTVSATSQPQDHSLPVLAMPSVRAYAREQNVNLADVNGTGNHHQILRTDIDAFVAGGNAAPATKVVPTEDLREGTTTKENKTVAAKAALLDEQWPETREKMDQIRKATAKSVTRSVAEIPHVHIFDEVVVDKLWAHRKKYKEAAANRGVKLTFLAYVVKALAVVMKEYPVFNSSVDMANNEIVYKNYVNVGIATDTPRGLFMPNVKNADRLSLFNIARAISDNTTKAKDGKLTVADMRNGGMSITNIGSVGGGYFTPVINWPEVAILGIGRISQEPVVLDEKVQVARVMKLTLAFDHRVIDGATGQSAMNRLKELLGDPEILLMEG
ncbi:2-oxo acid dehydrogenase subunit E2 [Ligilactobacillus sp. WILCCON 0076]|uniref:Dihydrolipoamide acetyltransferase component of pyruvate dehydrogenase complex n=1 Tax=Ligilactobacillus ubinensis TaxID=2876789 RepID=A0A9X2JLP2_9LACO|nr:2-oxo acid dehydrogenase subunit E2 [Ligilactobacillus ubinensis]MCP0887188.1 2-oxo acid dehydrogenase subunit E2 [Ligilactobacillus ubinensis]